MAKPLSREKLLAFKCAYCCQEMKLKESEDKYVMYCDCEPKLKKEEKVEKEEMTLNFVQTIPGTFECIKCHNKNLIDVDELIKDAVEKICTAWNIEK